MKQLFFVLLSLVTLSSYSQSINARLATPNDAKKGNFEYVNLSAESSIEIIENTNLFLDFGTMDIPKEIDQFVVKTGVNDSIVFDQFQPVFVSNINEAVNIECYAIANKERVNFASSGKDKLSFKVKKVHAVVFENDEIVFGILAIVLAFIFFTSHKQTPFWQTFYRIIPALLLCYVVPAILVLFGLISPEYSGLYPMARDYLLPAALVLMTLGIDFKAILNLGSKAIIMFLAGTVGVIIGGPLAILIYKYIDPSVVGGEGFEAAWRGMATIAGSWIGGGANQNAMYETYRYAPELYGKMIVVDIVVANMWMAFLLIAAAKADVFDRWLKSDTTEIENLKHRMSDYQASIARQASLTDYMVILGIAFGVVAISHFGGEFLSEWFKGVVNPDNPLTSSFLWLVVIATTGGLILSATKLRAYEGAGASKVGSVFIYILVATIGMKMELAEAVKEPQLILVGMIWMIFHAGFMFLIAKLIKAPLFFLAVGSKANIGGAASAPIIASAFHPSLASVGAILAVLGYALGTYGAILCAELMRWLAP